MKCPWREHTYIDKNTSGTNIDKTVEWLDCYKEQCPFYDKDLRRKKPDICLRPYRED